MESRVENRNPAYKGLSSSRAKRGDLRLHLSTNKNADCHTPYTLVFWHLRHNRGSQWQATRSSSVSYACARKAG